MTGRAVRISESALVPAPPAAVYAIIADYRGGHPRILPRQLSDLVVEQGGYGAGTVIRYVLTLAGRRVALRAAVEEPEPGRLLVERALDAPGGTTSFRVEPASAETTRVSITTEWTTHGLFGRLQARLAERLFPPMFREELRLLGEVAAAEARPPG
jgi:hypothetical protein